MSAVPQPTRKGITMATKIVVEFELEKTTKGALKYSEAKVQAGQEPKIGTLYLRKAHFPGEPKSVKVTVETK